jgi:predicted nucleic acid-binding protein
MEAHPETYLLDTSALSEFTLKEPHPSFISWVLTVPERSLAVSASAVIEIQRGIEKIKASNPVRAGELDEWLTALLGRTDVRYLPMNPKAARLFGKMTSVPILKNLWVPHPHANNPKLGQDLQVAAISIAHQAPIASMNIRDFLLIHVYFPLPGLFNPLSGGWEIPCRAMRPTTSMQKTGASLHSEAFVGGGRSKF